MARRFLQKICMVGVLSVLFLGVVSSCKKSEPAKKESASPSAQPAETAGAKAGVSAKQEQAPSEAVQAVPAEAASPEPVPAPCCAAAPAAAADKSADKGQADKSDLAPIPLDLPRAMFEGTPQNIQMPNMEKPRSEPRPSFYAPKGTVNIALDKPVTSTDEDPVIGRIEYITDGDKSAADGSFAELGLNLQHVTIDLEEKCTIYAVVLWHYHKQARCFKDVIVQVADDPDFLTNVQTIFNNDHDNSAGLGIGEDLHYVETNEGKLIDAKGVQGRYVRCYSNGSNQNELNYYIEVEVYGKKMK